MAYMMKSREDFQKFINSYLEEYPIEVDDKQNQIQYFSSNNLSDLYKLFLNLKNTKLNENAYSKLITILQEFRISETTIFPLNENIIKQDNIHRLEIIIKDKYINYISTPSEIDENEIYNLSVIVNKIFPEVFLDLVKNPNSNIKEQQKYIESKFLSTVDHWHSHNTEDAEIENRDIAFFIYNTARKLYPQLNLYVLMRIKSMKSSLSNVNKEFKKGIMNLQPSSPSEGISIEDVKQQFTLEGANSDFSGFTIVLTNTDDILHFDINDPRTKNSKVLELRKTRKNNLDFIHSLGNFLTKNEDNDLSYLDLLQIKIELLIKLRDSTYPQCTKEFKDTSFTKILEKTLSEYNNISNNSDIDEFSNRKNNSIQLLEIHNLLDELKKRVHDKYQTQILEIVIPEIFDDKVFSDTLKLKIRFVKTVIKENGFYSTYYELITHDGRKIELQVQSYMRFKDSKNGPSDHSKLPNKSIDISQFFEPTDSDCDPEQYQKFLELLNTISYDKKNFLYNAPDSQLSFEDIKLKNKLKLAERNIKIKDYIDFDETYSLPIEIYLPEFAEFVSPILSSVSSHHTQFNNIASYHKKSLISCFTEVLLKHDSITCLSQQLIDKLESIIPNEISEITESKATQRALKRYQKPSQNFDEQR